MSLPLLLPKKPPGKASVCCKGLTRNPPEQLTDRRWKEEHFSPLHFAQKKTPTDRYLCPNCAVAYRSRRALAAVLGKRPPVGRLVWGCSGCPACPGPSETCGTRCSPAGQPRPCRHPGRGQRRLTRATERKVFRKTSPYEGKGRCYF